MDEDECECDEGAPAWMATFSDLATLLLTFFVLLLSFAEMDITEFKTMLGSIKDAFGVETVAPGVHHAASTSPIEFADSPTSLAQPLNDRESTLLRAIRRWIQSKDMEEQMSAFVDERGIVIRLNDQVLFDTGSARLKDEASPVLSRMHELAQAFPQGLSIEGHTDDRPIHTARFPSNWELSTARATATLQEMRRLGGLGETMMVVGYADTRPIHPNDTAEHRAANRRVEFVFSRGADEGGVSAEAAAELINRAAELAERAAATGEEPDPNIDEEPAPESDEPVEQPDEP